MTLEVWPSILRPRKLQFHIQPSLTVGPQSFGGLRQKRGGSAGFWTASASFDVYSADEIREWRGVVAALQGGLGTVKIGVFDDRQAPHPLDAAGRPILPEDEPFSDGTFFTDGRGFLQSTIMAYLAEPLALRATVAQVRVEVGGDLKRGMYFSVAGRLYLITSQPTRAGSIWTFRFLPEFRVAADADTWVELRRPTALMMLASEDTGALSLESFYQGHPEIAFTESWDGL